MEVMHNEMENKEQMIDKDELSFTALKIESIKTVQGDIIETFFEAFNSDNDDPLKLAFTFNNARDKANAVFFLLCQVIEELKEMGISAR